MSLIYGLITLQTPYIFVVILSTKSWQNKTNLPNTNIFAWITFDLSLSFYYDLCLFNNLKELSYSFLTTVFRSNTTGDTMLVRI